MPKQTQSMIRLLATFVLTLTLATPALAGGGGGFPAVELDAPPPSNIEIGEVITVGFMVLSHGSPFDHVEPYLSALHKESKESFRADALKDGKPGHFMVEAKFHEAGTWFWEIVLPDMGSTTLAPVTVGATALPDAFSPEAALPASIHRGGCDQLGEIAFPLEALGDGTAVDEPVGSAAALPVRMSVTVVDASMADILAGEHVIAIAIEVPGAGAGAGAAASPVACGEIGGRLIGGALPLGLHGIDGNTYAGIAVLEETGDQTTVTTYLTADTAADATLPPAAADPALTINIQNFTFNPLTTEIKAGETVTWKNLDSVPHTVTFDDMTFADSPILEHDDSFSLTFDTPGSYTYLCNPHPNMTGTVVVT